jgi:hypothetical protein
MELNATINFEYSELSNYLFKNGKNRNIIIDKIIIYEGFIKFDDVITTFQSKDNPYEQKISLIRNVVNNLHSYIINNIQNTKYTFIYNGKEIHDKKNNDALILGGICFENDTLINREYENHFSIYFGIGIHISCSPVNRLTYGFKIGNVFTNGDKLVVREAINHLNKIVNHQKYLLCDIFPVVVVNIITDYSYIKYTIDIISNSIKAGLKVSVDAFYDDM